MLLDFIPLHKLSYQTHLIKVQCLATAISGQALYFFPIIGVCDAFMYLGLCPKPQGFFQA